MHVDASPSHFEPDDDSDEREIPHDALPYFVYGYTVPTLALARVSRSRNRLAYNAGQPTSNDAEHGIIQLHGN